MATSLMVLARLSSLLVAALILVWALGFRTSFLPHSSTTSHLDHLYSALHPLLMVIGFILLSGEAILVHRWMLGWSRGARKAAHLWLQGAALSFGSFGVWARFRRRNGVVANFYSLHSWMGLLCVFLFAVQISQRGSVGAAILVHRWMLGWSRVARKAAHLWLQGAALSFGSFGVWARFRRRNGVVANIYSLRSWMGLLCVFLFAVQWVLGFMSFWHHGERRSTRTAVLPWHVFIGLYTYGLAVVTAETGLMEKFTFLQTRHQILHRSCESILINSIGISLALLCGIVSFAAVSPKHKQATHSSNHKISYRKSGANGDCISYQRPKVVPADDTNVRWISS